jgi:hypothetical protein
MPNSRWVLLDGPLPGPLPTPPNPPSPVDPVTPPFVPPTPVPTPTPDINPLIRSQSRYRFVITDMIGRVAGEVLECSNKEFIQGQDTALTATFTIKISNPMNDFIENNDCLCKCYRRPVNGDRYRLLLVGDVLTSEEDTNTETGTATYIVAGPLNRLAWRMLGKGVDESNHGIGWSYGTAEDPKDVMEIIGEMLKVVNEDPDLGYTGISLGDRVPFTTGIDTYVVPVYFQPFATQFAVYTAVVDGFDFWFEPLEPHLLGSSYPGSFPDPYDPDITLGTTVRNTCISRMNLYFPSGNFQRPDGSFSKHHPFPVFEYGTGKHNIQSYKRTRDKSNLINQWYNLATGFPTANSYQDPLVKSNPSKVIGRGGYTVQDSINDRGGLESVAPGDLGAGSTYLRQQLVDTTAAVTSFPRQQITFVPTINCDVDWTVDYFCDDVVTVRAYIPEINSWRFNGTCRIYGIDAAIDDNEQEQITLITIPIN